MSWYVVLPVFEYRGYKPHTSNHRDVQTWTGPDKDPPGTSAKDDGNTPATEMFCQGVMGMIEVWEFMEETVLEERTRHGDDGQDGEHHLRQGQA